MADSKNPLYALDALRLEIATKHLASDGTIIDPTALKAFIKRGVFWKISGDYHPDKVAGDKARGEIFKTLSAANDVIEAANSEQLQQYVVQFLNGHSGDEAVLAQAMQEITTLDEKVHRLLTDLSLTQTTLMQVANGGRIYSPKDVIVYRDRSGLVITLDNADREISRILTEKRKDNPELVRKLTETERQIKKYQVQENKYKAEVETEKKAAIEAANELKKVRDTYKKSEVSFRDQKSALEMEVVRYRTQGEESTKAAENMLTQQQKAYEQQLSDQKKKYEAELKKTKESPVAKAIIEQIKVLRDNKKPQEALALCDLVLSADPTHPDAIYFAGTIYASLGQKEQAIDYFSRLPKHSSAQAYLARLK